MKKPVSLILPLLPARVRPYAKAVVATLGASASIALLYAGDSPHVVSAVAALTALGVFAQPNEE